MSFVVGTAGHIDHGKSTLVTALTGIDPDRLAEEKRRGMTIDLGFAYMKLPSGREIGIVDVPGHARFMRNMLAGAHGLDAVLLVVAADEGVMPQTREHLEILDLLDVRRGLVVMTKVDLADEEWVELVKTEVTSLLEGTSLEGAPVMAVSAATGAGVPELVTALDSLLEESEPRADAGRPRLPIDRVFTMSGFGTVVTGTLVDGSIEEGDDMEVAPGGRLVRIRGLQRHNEKVDSVGPGERVAANLSGVEKSDLSRGDVLARPGAVAPTRRIDATMRVLASAPQAVRHGAELMLHTGTSEVISRVIVLEGDEIAPGALGWVQLYLERPIAALAHDRFVLRVPSPAMTVAGGTFVDVGPRKHPRHDSAVRESLVRRAAGNVMQEELRKYPRGVTVSALLKATVAPSTEVDKLQARRLGEWIFSEEAWGSIAARAAHELDAFHGLHPLRSGMAREELRSRLGVPAASFPAVVRGLIEDGRVVERNGSLAAPQHSVALETEGGPAADLIALLQQGAYAPPSLAEAKLQTGATDEVVRALAQRGDIVRVSDDIAFSKDAYESAVAIVKDLIAANGSVTVAQLRDRMGASRRPMLALLEYLDAQRLTRRIGDARVLR
ncbi:MAG TPA: selenocysteine-specific translation elongation factor [Candidatus Dormibacteraeota bacterium]|nr:selenocysteine-specific translation elongation factor [Candidatus Dormibacteraeota bacterium]